MAITRTAPAKPAEPKSQRTPRRAAKSAPEAEPESTPFFDPAAHQKEIAQVAYRVWLERADRPGSPEQDWLEAQAEVRAKYTR